MVQWLQPSIFASQRYSVFNFLYESASVFYELLFLAFIVAVTHRKSAP
jgi:hypothetical protein